MNILNISIGLVGLTSSLTGLHALTNSALQAYAANENLVSSLDALVAKQIALTKEMEITEARKKSTAVTQELVEWTQKLGIQSPFSQDGIANSFKMAMAFGMNINMAKQATAALVDFTAATGQSAYVMEGAMMAMGQAFSKGKLQGEEALQLIERGVPVWEYLRRVTGKTNAELQDMSSKGVITAKQAIDALIQGMNEDFGGAAASSQYSIEGLLSSFEDLGTVAKTVVATPAILAFKPSLIRASDTLGSLETIEKMKRAGLSLIETGERIAPAFQFAGDILKETASYAASLKDNLHYIPGDLLISSQIPPTMQTGRSLNIGTEEMLEGTPEAIKGTFSGIASIISSSKSLIENALKFAFTYKVTKFLLPFIPAFMNFFKSLPALGLNAFYSGFERIGSFSVGGIGERFKNAVIFDFKRNFVQKPIVSFFKEAARTGWGAFQHTLAQEQRGFKAFLTRWMNAVGNPMQGLFTHAMSIGKWGNVLRLGLGRDLSTAVPTFFNMFQNQMQAPGVGLGTALQNAFSASANQIDAVGLSRRTRMVGKKVNIAFRDEMKQLTDYSKRTFKRVARTFAIQQFVMPTAFTVLPVLLSVAAMKWAEYRREVEATKEAMIEASPWFENVNDALAIVQDLKTQSKWTQREYRQKDFIAEKELAELRSQKEALEKAGVSTKDEEFVRVVTRITQIEEEVQLRSDHIDFLEDKDKQLDAYDKMLNKNKAREDILREQQTQILLDFDYKLEDINKFTEKGILSDKIKEKIPELEELAKAHKTTPHSNSTLVMTNYEGAKYKAAAKNLKKTQSELEAIGKSNKAINSQINRVDNETAKRKNDLSINMENTKKAAEATKDYAKALREIAKIGKGLGDSLADIELDTKAELKEAGKGKKIEELEEIKELEEEYNKDISERIAQYNKDRADAKEEFHKEEQKRIKEYHRREEEAEARHTEEMIQMAMERLRELDEMAEAAKPKTQSALDALATTEADFQKDAKKRLEDWNKKRQLLAKQGAMCKLPEERKAFEEQERQAAEAYMRQEQQQRAALGRQLIDFTIAMALRNDVSAQAMEEMVTGIARSTGAYDSMTSDILGKTFSGIASWAKSGGQGTEAVLANIRELPRAAREAKVAEDELASSMREQAVANYLRTGDLETYQRELNEIPKKVSQSLTDQSIENVWQSSKAWNSQQEYQRKVEDAETQFQQERRDAHKDHLQLMQDEEQAFKDNLREIDEAYTEDMDELWADYQEEERKRIADHHDKITKIEGEARDERIEDAMRAADREAAIEIAKIEDIEARQKAVKEYMEHAASQQEKMIWLDERLDKIDYSSDEANAQREAALLDYARYVTLPPSVPSMPNGTEGRSGAELPPPPHTGPPQGTPSSSSRTGSNAVPSRVGSNVTPNSDNATITLNIDGKEFARTTYPILSEQIARELEAITNLGVN